MLLMDERLEHFAFPGGKARYCSKELDASFDIFDLCIISFYVDLARLEMEKKQQQQQKVNEVMRSCECRHTANVALGAVHHVSSVDELVA